MALPSLENISAYVFQQNYVHEYLFFMNLNRISDEELQGFVCDNILPISNSSTEKLSMQTLNMPKSFRTRVNTWISLLGNAFWTKICLSERRFQPGLSIPRGHHLYTSKQLGEWPSVNSRALEEHAVRALWGTVRQQPSPGGACSVGSMFLFLFCHLLSFLTNI